MERRDGRLRIDQDLIMIFRAAFMLRSVAMELGMRIKLTDVWREYALELKRMYPLGAPADGDDARDGDNGLRLADA